MFRTFDDPTCPEGPAPAFADYRCINCLHGLAETTQAIDLDHPLFVEDQRAEEERQRRLIRQPVGIRERLTRS